MASRTANFEEITFGRITSNRPELGGSGSVTRIVPVPEHGYSIRAKGWMFREILSH